MVKYAIIENGTVTNVAVSSSALESNWVQSDTAAIGDTYDGTTFTRPDNTPTLEERRAAMAVPRLAARLALIDASLWDSIPALIDGIEDASVKARTLAFFEDAQNWQREDATVQALAAGLGLSDTELDGLFDAAAVIQAGL